MLAIGEGGGGFQIAMQAVFATEIVQLACNIRVAPEPFVPLARALLRSRISSLSFGTAFTIALRSDQDCITQMESGRKLRYSSSIARPTLERYASLHTRAVFMEWVAGEIPLTTE